MAEKIKIFQFPIKGGDFEHIGNATIETRKLIKISFTEEECFKNTSFFSSSRDFLRRFGICAYEAEANVIIHARYGLFKTILCCKKIKGEVIDRGPGIPSILNALTPGFSTASDAAKSLGFGAGVGLNNIQKIADFTMLHSEKGKGTSLQFEVWKVKDNEIGRIAMKIKQIIKALKLELVTKNVDMEKEVKSAYSCDLLSNVLAKAGDESAWLTVQTNMNIIGVATIKKIPIIIIAENSTIPKQTIAKAEENEIIIAKGKQDIFTISGKLYELFQKE